MSTIDLTLKINADGTVDAQGKLKAVSSAVASTGDAAKKAGKDYGDFNHQIGTSIDSLVNLGARVFRFGQQLVGVFTKDMTVTNSAFREFDDVIQNKFIKTVGEAVVKNDALSNAVGSLAGSLEAMLPTGKEVDATITQMTKVCLDLGMAVLPMGEMLLNFVGLAVEGLAAISQTMLDVIFRPFSTAMGLINNVAQEMDFIPQSLKGTIDSVAGIMDLIVEIPTNSKRDIMGVIESLQSGMAGAYAALEKARGAADGDGTAKVLLNKKALEEANKALIASEKELADAISKGVDVALTAWDKEEAAKQKSLDYMQKSINDKLKADNDAAKANAKNQGEASKLRTKEIKEVKTLSVEQQMLASVIESAAMATVGAIQVAIEGLMTGTKSVSEAIGGMMLSVAQSIFSSMMSASLAYAVETAIAGAGSVASIPYVGAFLAIGMVGTILTTMLAVRSKMKAPSKEYGGLTSTGLMENMPVIVNSKERILNEREAREYEASKSGVGNQGRALVINTSVPQGVSNRLETQRYLRDVWVPELKKMKATGQLKWLTA
jgi:hypothetical protein